MSKRKHIWGQKAQVVAEIKITEATSQFYPRPRGESKFVHPRSFQILNDTKTRLVLFAFVISSQYEDRTCRKLPFNRPSVTIPPSPS